MSELREECYKCLNNQSCPGSADYGSIICMTKRKFKMPRNNEKDSIYATKFAVMQQQINEKDKRIKELEEERDKEKDKTFENCLDVLSYYISKQKVKELEEKIINYKIPRACRNGYYYDYLVNQEYKEVVIKLFKEILEDK